VTGEEYFKGYLLLMLQGYSHDEANEILENVKNEMEQSKITVWSVDKNGKLSHNHIENGWVEGDIPQPLKPVFKNQLSWANMKWHKRFTYLKDGKVLEYDLKGV
jgi:hypothetical protein